VGGRALSSGYRATASSHDLGELALRTWRESRLRRSEPSSVDRSENRRGSRWRSARAERSNAPSLEQCSGRTRASSSTSIALVVYTLTGRDEQASAAADHLMPRARCRLLLRRRNGRGQRLVAALRRTARASRACLSRLRGVRYRGCDTQRPTSAVRHEHGVADAHLVSLHHPRRGPRRRRSRRAIRSSCRRGLVRRRRLAQPLERGH